MEAIYTAPVIERRGTLKAIGSRAASLGALLVEIVKDGIAGHDFERAFTGAPGAQFAALPASSRQQLLNRGLRP